MDPEGYINLGDTSQSEGNFKQAIGFYQRALSTAKEIGDKQSEEIAYHYLGNAYHSLNDFKKEIENHQQALIIAKEIQDKSLEGVVYCSLGNAYHLLSDFKSNRVSSPGSWHRRRN